MKSIFICEGKNDVKCLENHLENSGVDCENFFAENFDYGKRGNQQTEFVRSLLHNEAFCEAGLKSEEGKPQAKNFFCSEITTMTDRLDSVCLMIDMDGDLRNPKERMSKEIEDLNNLVRQDHSDHQLIEGNKVIETEYLVSKEAKLERIELNQTIGTVRVLAWKTNLENVIEREDIDGFDELRKQIKLQKHINAII